MASKRSRVQDKEIDEPSTIPIPSSILIKFARHDGSISGNTLEIPTSSTIEQLEILLNSILENEEKRPYAFFINDTEVTLTIQETLQNLQQHNFEESINIVYEPLSLYRVRPITRCVETMFGHADAVLHVSYSPDGRHLASGGGDSIVRFWNITSSMPLHTCKGHRSHVLCSAWAPDGNCFVTADKSGEIRVWNPFTGQQRGKEMHAHSGFVTSLSFEPFHLNSRCMRLASSSKDKSVIIWNIVSCQAEATLYTHTDSVECVKWGGRGLLYTASRDRTIKVWGADEESGHFKLVRTLSGHAHRINSLALNTDYVLRTGPFQLGSPQPTLDEDESVRKEAAAVARSRYEEVVSTVGEVMVSCSDDFTLIMWKPVEGKLPITRMTGHQQIVNHIAFSPDGRFLASASFDRKIKLWCGRTGNFLTTMHGHVASVYQVAWSPDSAFLVSSSKDSTVKLWSMKDRKKALNTFAGHEDEVYALDWSPAASSIASGSKDRTIRIWGR